VKAITIELDNSEFRILRGTAYKQVRSPENLARYLIIKSLGLTSDEHESTNANSDVNTQEGSHVAAAA